MFEAPIELKGGNFTLSVIYIKNATPEKIQCELKIKMDQYPDFFKNAPIVINISELDKKSDWTSIANIFTNSGLHIIGVSGCQDESSKRSVLRSGLPLMSEGKKSKDINWPATSQGKTKFVNNPVRSGQQIYAYQCDLIVTGNVSAGAELVADGNIHVYGMMRGRALAGASGNTQSRISCLHFLPELVSISGCYWLSEQIPAEFFGKAAQLSLSENNLTIHTLD